jgi:hypothetical protein
MAYKNLKYRVNGKGLHQANVVVVPGEEELMWIVGRHGISTVKYQYSKTIPSIVTTLLRSAPDDVRIVLHNDLRYKCATQV